MRDARQMLDRYGVNVVGISPDPPDQQKKFQQKHDLGFDLLCDEDHAVADRFGVWGEKKMYGKTYKGIIRSAFLIDASGEIVDAWYKISPKDTVALLAKRLESLNP